MLRMDAFFNIEQFYSDAIESFVPNLSRGKLGLVAKTDSASKPEAPVVDLLALTKDNETMVQREPMTKEMEWMAKKKRQLSQLTKIKASKTDKKARRRKVSKLSSPSQAGFHRHSFRNHGVMHSSYLILVLSIYKTRSAF